MQIESFGGPSQSTCHGSDLEMYLPKKK